MSRSLLLIVCVLLLISTMLAGCGPSQESAVDKLVIAVSIQPQKTFVERIGGENVEVIVIVEPGASAETYEPKPQKLRELGRAAAYFTIGVAFEEAWFDRIRSANAKMQIFDQAQGIVKIPSSEVHHNEAREAVGEAEHGDPHIWLSPRLVKIQANSIAEALTQLDPDNTSKYLENLEAFQSEIDALDAEIASSLADLPNRNFLVVHPAWGYFARDYNLTMISIEVEGQEPSAAELAQIIEKATEAQAKKIFAQPEFNSRTADVIAKAIGAEVVLISDLAPDWAANLKRFVETLLQ